jgi:hypothetical protein
MVSTHSLLQYFPYSGKIRVGFWDHLVLVISRGVHLNGICTCVVYFTNLIDCYYICCLFNMTCPSLVPILSEVNVVSAIPYGWVNINYLI